MALARKHELAFGLCFGKKIEDSVFLLHKVKAAKVLGKQAKADGETPQFTFGRLKLDGKELSLIVEGKMLPGMARKVKKMFMIVGLKYSIIVLDPGGTVMEAEQDEEGESPESARATQGEAPLQPAEAGRPASGSDHPESPPQNQPESSPEEQPDPAANTWNSTAVKVESNLAKLRDIAGIDLSRAEAIWKALQAKADTGAFTAALDHISKLTAEMKTAAQEAAIRAKRHTLLEAKWQQAAAKLEPLIAEVLALKSAQSDKIQAVWTQINARVSASPPDYEGALKTVAPLAQAISKARQAAAAALQEDQASSAPPAAESAQAGDGDTATLAKPKAPVETPEDAAPPVGEPGADATDEGLAEQIARIEATLKALRDGAVKT
jgi:chemotaxis protein histidine kinase CheA